MASSPHVCAWSPLPPVEAGKGPKKRNEFICERLGGNQNPSVAPRLSWKVRSARDRTKRTIQIGVRSEFFQNSRIFARKFKNFGKSKISTFSKIFAKSRQIFIKHWAKFNAFFRISVNFATFCRKMRKSLTKIFWNIEVWAVQKHVNLVDLVKSFPTNIYL